MTDPESRTHYARWSSLRLGTVLVGMLIWISMSLLHDRAFPSWAGPIKWVGWLVMMAALGWQIAANIGWRRAHPLPSSQQDDDVQ